MNQAPISVSAPVPVSRFLARLSLGVGAIAAFVIGLTWSALEQSRRHHQERAYIAAQNLAQVLEQSLSSSLEKSDIGLYGIAHEYAEHLVSGHLDAAGVNRYIADTAARLSFANGMGIADSRGLIRYGLGVTAVGSISIADRDYFVRLRDDPDAGLVWSKPVLGRVSGKWLINLARRVALPDGSFGGVVYAGVWLENLTKIFASVEVGRQGIVTLRDANFNLIVRYPELPAGPSIGKQTMTPELRALIAAGKEHGVYTVKSVLDGIERTNAFRKVGNQPLYVTVGFGTEEYMRDWRDQAERAWMLVGLFMFGVLASATAVFQTWRRRAAAVEKLFAQEEELRLAASVFGNTMDGVMITDLTPSILSVNPAFTDITGYPAEAVIGRKPSLLSSDHHGRDFYGAMWAALLSEGRWQGEIWNRRQNGEIYLAWLTINAIADRDGRRHRYVGVFSDITELHRRSEHLRHQAFHDPLTGLPNRALLMDRLEHGLTYARREERRFGILFVDLDGFKAINDAHGHDIGDRLLQEVARRLMDSVRQSDTVARLGGDEFVILAELSDGRETLLALAEKVLGVLRELLNIDGRELRIGASIGIACFPEDGTSADELMRCADTAMYAAKAAGRGTWRLSQIKADATCAQ